MVFPGQPPRDPPQANVCETVVDGPVTVPRCPPEADAL